MLEVFSEIQSQYIGIEASLQEVKGFVLEGVSSLSEVSILELEEAATVLI